MSSSCLPTYRFSQPTNKPTMLLCIPQLHLPPVCLPLHLSPSALCCSFVFKQLGAAWPWLEKELLFFWSACIALCEQRQLWIGARSTAALQHGYIPYQKRANKELSIIQGGKTLDLYLGLNQQTDMLLLQNTSRQYQKLIC